MTGSAETATDLRVAESPRTGHPPRIDYLDGIRALAILAVLSFHWNHGFAPGLFGGGYVGVDMFLALSGYLITSILIRRSSPTMISGYLSFLRARVRRLYPALIGLVVGLIVLVALGGSFVQHDREPSFWSYFTTLTQLSWIPVVDSWGANAQALIHTWSLAVEWTFYLAWPFVVWRFLRDRKNAWAIVFTVAVAVWFVAAVTLPWQWFYACPIARGAQLALGCALALYVDERRREGVTWPTAAPRRGIAMALVSLGWLGYWVLLTPASAQASYKWVAFLLVPAATIGLVVGGAMAESVRRILGLAPLAALGRVSYSLYLWHVPMVQLLTPASLGVSKASAALVVLVGTAGCTTVSYWFLERPYFKARSRST